MYRMISGAFDNENGSAPITFLPAFKVRYSSGVITVCKDAPLYGTPWPGTARQRRIHQALDEKNLLLMNSVIPPGCPREVPEGKLKKFDQKLPYNAQPKFIIKIRVFGADEASENSTST